MADNLSVVRDEYIKFLLAQIAAEAYLDDLPDGKKLEDQVIDTSKNANEPNNDAYNDPNSFTGRLALGPNHYDYFELSDYGTEEGKKQHWSATMATRYMLDKFNAQWTVIDQIPNAGSGFSATLLQDKAGNYTLSFRSTESKIEDEGGDVVRDSTTGANGEITSKGFAWAQIMDMEQYFQDLKVGKLASE